MLTLATDSAGRAVTSTERRIWPFVSPIAVIAGRVVTAIERTRTRRGVTWIAPVVVIATLRAMTR
jgi:hypothetical protein